MNGKGRKSRGHEKTKGLKLFARTIMNYFSFVAWQCFTATKTEFDSNSRDGGRIVLHRILWDMRSNQVRDSYTAVLLDWPFR